MTIKTKRAWAAAGTVLLAALLAAAVNIATELLAHRVVGGDTEEVARRQDRDAHGPNRDHSSQLLSAILRRATSCSEKSADPAMVRPMALGRSVTRTDVDHFPLPTF